MAQYLGINKCIIITKYALYCLLYLTVIQCTTSQNSSIGISDTRLLLKEAAIISLICQVSAFTTSTDVTGGTFTWKHTRDTGVVDNYDDNTVKTIARIRIESVSLNITAPFSSLVIFNSTADDSGIISCQYNYQEDSGSTQTLSVDTFVCVSTVPEPPQCLQTGQDGTDIICYWDGICPNNDNVTLQWLDGDSMQALNGNITRSNTTIETNLVTDTNIDNYLCKLESDLYPEVQFNCSISNVNQPSSIPSTPSRDATTPADAKNTRNNGDTSPLTSTKISQLSTSSIPPDELTSSASCGWAVYTTILFAVISVISIIINVFFGIKQYRQTPNDLKSSPNSDKPTGTVHMIQGQESYMELERVDAENQAYTSLKRVTKGAAAAVGADYEVTLPDTSSMRNEDIDTRNSEHGEGAYINEWRVGQFTSSNTKPAK